MFASLIPLLTTMVDRRRKGARMAPRPPASRGANNR
jgi:hypothetical protein